MIRAPGKVILLGEHAVVHGAPAIAAALDRGVTIEIGPGQGRLIVPQWGLAAFPGNSQPVAQAFALVEDRLGVRVDRHDLLARFEIPVGAGLGSSAALSICLCRAVAEAGGRALDEATLLDAAQAAETVFHGQASGIDHAVSARGGLGLFTRRDGLRPLAAARPIPLVVGDTGRQRDTRSRVARVAALLESAPDATRAAIAAIAALVERAAALLAAGDLAGLGAALDENQGRLAALDASCDEIDRMCRLAREAGALGAKLTGGGGGGCVIALAPGRETDVQAAWSAAGFASFVAEVGR